MKVRNGFLDSFSSVQSLSHVQLFVTPWTAACQASLSTTNSWSLLNSCPLSWWCHPNISSSVIPFSSCLQSFPASESFQMSQFFTSGGQCIGVPASASVLPINIQGWCFKDWWVWSPCSPRDSQESSTTPWFKSINSSVLSFLYSPLSHPYMTNGKIIVLTRRTFDKVMSLLLNMLSRWS